MKSIDAPSSFSATQGAAAEDSSPTSLLPAIQPDSIETLTDTETLRVLEVRHPTLNAESADTRNSYAVRVDERFQPQQQARPALTLVPSRPRILPPPGAPAPTAAAHPTAASTRPVTPAAPKPTAPTPAKATPAPARALADELKSLTKDYVPELADLSSTTGVRHLRIELRKKPTKPHAGKKR